MITGEQGAGNLASPVREGADGKGPPPGAPRQRPTSLGGRPRGKGPAQQKPRRAADPSAWLTKFRRLVRDYETLPATHEAMIWTAATWQLSNRLTR